MEKKIIISAEDRDVVQKADVEMSARLNLISFMISNNMDITSEQFNRYQEEYTKYFLEFGKAKKALENKYIVPIYGTKTVEWALSYDDCELTLNVE